MYHIKLSNIVLILTAAFIVLFQTGVGQTLTRASLGKQSSTKVKTLDAYKAGLILKQVQGKKAKIKSVSKKKDDIQVVTMHESPVQISPDNEATDISLTTILEWYSVSTAEYYELQVATDIDFTDIIIDETGLSDTTFSIADGVLSNNTTYYWQVRAAGGELIESDWSLRSFTTVAGDEALSSPELVAPDNDAADVTLTPSLDWNSVTDATKYDLEISEQIDFSSIDYSEADITETGYTMPSGTLNNGHTYHWRCRAKNSSTESDWSARAFTTEYSSEIEPPELVSPDNWANNVGMPPHLDWSDVEGAESYGVQIYTNTSTPELVLDESGITESEYDVDWGELLFDTQYKWKVNVTVDNNVSDWSGYRHFKTEKIGKPSLESPNHWQKNVGLTPALDWEDYDHADSYCVQVSETSDFSTLIVNECSLTSSEYTVPDDILLYDTKYYWKVKVIIGEQSGPWSNYRVFRTMEVPKPSLLSPSNWSDNVSITPQLDWSSVDDADSYNLQIATDSDFDNMISEVNDITESEYTVPSGILDYHTKYFWRVSTNIGSQSSDWTRGWKFFTRSIGVPSLISPSNMSQGISLTPSLNWSDVDNADSYNLQLASDYHFDNLVLDLSDISESEYNIQSGTLLYNTQYYWRVNVNEGSQSGSWSYIYRFKTLDIEKPSLISPSNNARNISLTPTLEWGSLDYAERYNVQVSTNKNFNNIVYEANDVTGTSLSVPSGELSYSTTYYWRVNAEAGSQTGSWASAFKFTTRRAKEAEPEAEGLITIDDAVISIYPNPSSDRLWLQGSLNEKYEVRISIINLLGESIISYQIATDELDEMLDVSGLNSGSYLVKIETNFWTQTTMIIKQ